MSMEPMCEQVPGCDEIKHRQDIAPRHSVAGGGSMPHHGLPRLPWAPLSPTARLIGLIRNLLKLEVMFIPMIGNSLHGEPIVYFRDPDRMQCQIAGLLTHLPRTYVAFQRCHSVADGDVDFVKSPPGPPIRAKPGL